MSSFKSNSKTNPSSIEQQKSLLHRDQKGSRKNHYTGKKKEEQVKRNN